MTSFFGSLKSDVGSFVDKTNNAIDDALGFSTDAVSQKGTVKGLPWEHFLEEMSDPFWSPIDIQTGRWNKLYPYRLIVVDVGSQGPPKRIAGGGVSVDNTEDFHLTPEGGIEYVITQSARNGTWEFILPITPQQLKIQDQFSINTSATMRGVVEEHNGVKFKMITAKGTTGIWPHKPTKGGSLKSPSSLGSIFGGTLTAFQGVAEGVGQIAKSFSGEHPNSPDKAVLPKDSSAGEFSTGYFQALYLGQFLERYAQAKKNPRNKNWRLVFDIPKQNQSFVVTPISYDFDQTQQRPNEMLFTLQLKAWKRIDLQQSLTAAGSSLPELDANTFQRIIGTIESTRRTLGQAVNLVKAVRSDFRRSFDILRQTSLAVKDAAGFAFAVVDLPNQIYNDGKDAIKDSWVTLKDAFQRGPDANSRTNSQAAGNTISDPLSKQTTSTDVQAGSVINSVLTSRKINEGLSDDAVGTGALGDDAAQRLQTDPVNNVFENPEENFDLFNTISVNDVTFSVAQQNAIDDEINRIRLLTIDDFRQSKKELLSLALDISNNFGSGDETYAFLYGLPSPRERALPLTIEENEILVAIFESIQVFDILTATKAYDDANIENPLEFVGGLANEAGIDFETFQSKMLVPVPFGLTIEELAARYMGDANKWLEIVTLNGLRSPYIDEEGFELTFLSNADGRQLSVDDSEDRLFLGQSIVLQSDVVPPISRRIINIEKISDNNFLISVDGLANLDTLTTNDNAKLRGYLPGTVNSQNQIYIPVDRPSEEDDRTFEITSLDNDSLTKLSKIDFLLTEDFDVAFNAVGDFRLANGLTNLIQALKLKIVTKKGTLLRHLDFGLGLEYGVSVADIEQGAILNSLNKMIEGDDRYDSIESISFILRGSTLGINMAVKLPNNSGVVPISFDTRVA